MTITSHRIPASQVVRRVGRPKQALRLAIEALEVGDAFEFRGATDGQVRAITDRLYRLDGRSFIRNAFEGGVRIRRTR